MRVSGRDASETRDLQQLGCENGQGFHLSRPLSDSEVDLLLDSMLSETYYVGAPFMVTSRMSLTRH